MITLAGTLVILAFAVRLPCNSSIMVITDWHSIKR